MSDVPLQSVDELKYLGDIILPDLSWSARMKYIAVMATRKLWLLRKQLKQCTSTTKLAAHKSIIKFYLKYADIYKAEY